MSPQSAHPAKGLVFSGRDLGAIPWTLLGFILVSACLHAFGFFLFQTIYPAAAPVKPPPAQVGLLTPGTPEADAILRWIESEDPALAAQPAKAPIPNLTTLPYIPSYASAHARPTMASAAEPPLPYPDGASGLALVETAAAQPSAAQPVAAPAMTVVTFSSPLEQEGSLPSLGRLHAAGSGDAGMENQDRGQPARFLIGVSDRGEVRYVFLQDSSDDKSLDAAAAAILEQVRFRPSAAPLSWGFATFYWGSSVYTPPPEAPQ